MKKVLCVLSLILVGIASFLLTSCSKPTERKNIVGTYVLTTSTTTYYKKDQPDEVVDNIAKYGRKRYIIINEEDTGYYIYKSEGSFFVEEIRLEFALDKNNLCTKLNFVNGKGENYHFTITDKNNEVAFESSYLSLFTLKTYNCYTRFSYSTALSDLASFLDCELNPVPYEKYAYEGIWTTDPQPEGYKFRLINIHMGTMKAELLDQPVEGELVRTVVDITETATTLVIGDVVFTKVANTSDDGITFYELQSNNKDYYFFSLYESVALEEYTNRYNESH